MPPPAAAVQVIFEIVSVWLPSSVLIGAASFVFSVVKVHPAVGCTLIDAIGLSVGMVTSSFVVDASVFSFGTRNVSFVYPPWSADFGLTVTCADAGAAKA